MFVSNLLDNICDGGETSKPPTQNRQLLPTSIIMRSITTHAQKAKTVTILIRKEATNEYSIRKFPLVCTTSTCTNQELKWFAPAFSYLLTLASSSKNKMHSLYIELWTSNWLNYSQGFINLIKDSFRLVSGDEIIWKSNESLDRWVSKSLVQFHISTIKVKVSYYIINMEVEQQSEKGMDTRQQYRGRYNILQCSKKLEKWHNSS